MFYPSSLYHHCRIFASPAWTNEEICVITTHFITAYLLNNKESRSALLGKFILPRTSGQAQQAAVLSAQVSTTSEAQAAPSTSASTSKDKTSKSAAGPTAITTDQPATSSAPSSEQGKQGKAAKQKAPEQETAEQPKKVEILRSPENLTPR
jgi:hypothetical protein